jgi:hypothetical protein
MSISNHLLDISWIVPGVFRGSGGHANIFRHVAELSYLGHRNTIYCHNPNNRFESDEQLAQFIRENFVDTRARIRRTWTLEPCDVAIATHWSTARTVSAFSDCARKFYFVQDYEPYFHSMGLEYLQAEGTYRLGMPCITLGRWLTHVLTEQYNADADYFDFPVDASIYHTVPNGTRGRRIAFYAQPEKPRRCFELGVRALEIVNQAHPEVDIVLFGSDTPPNAPITFEYKNMGVISTLQCAELYRSSQVGLILSATNPSLIPVEMMACGCTVVDLDRENNHFDYEPGTISLAEPTPEAIASSIIRLLEDETARSAQSARARQMVTERSFRRSAQKIEMLLLKGWIAGRVSNGENLHLDDFQPVADEIAELGDGCVQTFTPTQNNLSEIAVCFSKGQGANANSTANCEIWDSEEDVPIFSSDVRPREIRDGSWHSFRFRAQPLSKNRKYRLILRTSALGSNTHVLYTEKPVYQRGRLLLGGEPTEGSLKFKTYYAECLPVENGRALTKASDSPRKGNPKRWEEYLSTRPILPPSSTSALLLTPSQDLRRIISSLNYPEAGILVASARSLLLIKHYSVWAWFHFQQSGSKMIRERALRRLRLILGRNGQELSSTDTDT